MNKRLAYLEQLQQSGKADAFARYALALEYRKGGRLDEALATFQALREDEPDYLAMYLMAGQILVEQSDEDRAAEWLRAGIELAKRVGDGKALGELEALLEDVTDS